MSLDQERHPEVARLYSYFAFDHLPPHLRAVSQRFAMLADALLSLLPDSPELTVCLRKLLESKDCAVRAALGSPDTDQPPDGPEYETRM